MYTRMSHRASVWNAARISLTAQKFPISQRAVSCFFVFFKNRK